MLVPDKTKPNSIYLDLSGLKGVPVKGVRSRHPCGLVFLNYSRLVSRAGSDPG